MKKAHFTELKDPLTVFPKINGRHPKFVERKWNIEETNKEQVPAVSNTMEGFLKQYKEKWKQEGETLQKELKNDFTWLEFGEPKQCFEPIHP